MNNIKDIKDLLEEFQERPIAFYSVYAKIVNKITSGLLLSQLLYWDKAMKHNEFYKTDNDIMQEICLGPTELKNAKKTLIKLNLIKITRKDIPAKSYYKINTNEVINKILSYNKTTQQVISKQQGKSYSNKPTIYTENNTKNTAESLSTLFNSLIQTDNLQEKEKFIKYWSRKNVKGNKEIWQAIKNFDIKIHWNNWIDRAPERTKQPTYNGDPMKQAEVNGYEKWEVLHEGKWKKFAGDKKDIKYI